MKNFNSFQPHSSGVTKKLFTLALGLLLMPLIVWAQHFRYGSISWTNLTGNTVVFKVSQAWRLSAFPNPPIGAVVITGTFDFGDATSPASINLTVTSRNPAEDWFYGEATLTHTYESPGSYTAFAQGCCRTSINSVGNWRTETIVDIGIGNSSPVSTIIPFVDVPVNNINYMFTVPAVDPDGNALSFRFSTSAEAGPGFVQPSGLSINSSTGQMSINTIGKVIGQLYTTQVMISNGSVEVPLDFIIRISPPFGRPPFFLYPPTPPDGTVFNVNAGQTLSFRLQAVDSDGPFVGVILSVAGAPVGSTFAPILPTVGNPVFSVFSWTTTPATVGSYVLSFKAQDNTLQSAITSVTINVIPDCNLSLSASITNVSCNSGNDGAIDLTISGAAGTPNILWSNNATTEDISGLTAGTYSVTVTDANGCEMTASYNVTEPTALTSSATVSTNVSCAGGSDGSAVVSVEGGTAPYQYTLGSAPSPSGIFTGLPAGSFNYTVIDANGCTSTGSFSVSEPTALTCAISVSPNPTVAGQAANTIFLGYGPQSVNLTGSGSGGTGSYTYDWGSAGSGGTVSVSPTVTTTYTLTVTDEKGCASTCNVTICVVDIRVPGTDGKKVYICHVPPGNPGNPQTLSVSIDAVPAHLSEHSGDRLGNCGLVIKCNTNTTAPFRSSAAKTSEVARNEIINRSFKVQAFPNPAKRDFSIRLDGVTSTERISLQVVDAQGRLVEKRENIIGNQILQIGNNYKPGSYFIKVTQGENTKTLSVIKSPN